MSFGLVLDEPADRDLVVEHDGIKFIVKEYLHEMYQGFTIDSVKQNGFTYYSIIPARPDMGGGCSTCSSCG